MVAVMGESGVDVRIVSPDVDADAVSKAAEFLGIGIPKAAHIRWPLDEGPSLRIPRSLNALASELKLTRAIRRDGIPDLFIDTVYKSTLPGLGRANIRYVHFPARDIRPEGISRRVLSRVVGVARAAVRRSTQHFAGAYDVVLANSAFTAKHTEERWGVPADVLYPPCPLLGRGRASARQKRILSVGRFQGENPNGPHKRQDLLIEEFAKLRDLHDDGWELHLAGSVSSRRELDRLRQIAGTAPVVFHPDAPFGELVDLYGTSWIYCHAQGAEVDEDDFPEAHEHFGISVVEALSAGLIPVVHASGGPKEIVEPVAAHLMWDSRSGLRESLLAAVRLPAPQVEAIRRSAAARAREFDEQAFDRRFRSIVDRQLGQRIPSSETVRR